jgi:uncharacterized repeat protein (TIGR03803 family)
MRKPGFGKVPFILVVFYLAVFCVATGVASPAQTYTRLVKFSGTDGQWPEIGPLLQGIDGNLYGTNSFGGAGCASCGNVFQVTPDGKLSITYSFGTQTDDGAVPYAGLAQDVDGNFYGVTTAGGSHGGAGIAFKLTPAGKLTTLYNFCSQHNSQGGCQDGTGGAYQMFEAMNGNFYGTSSAATVNSYSTIFQITPAGKITTVYTALNANNAVGGLIQAANGNFYGFQQEPDSTGEFFELTSAGKFTTLYTFPQSEGYPTSLIVGADGNFYGATYGGGTTNSGTIFKLSPSGEYTLLYSFCSQANCADGAEANQLVQGTDGNFYGTTQLGGAVKINGIFEGYGTIFQITPAGLLTTLHTFCLQGGDCVDGAYPMSGLIQGTDGTFYGMTYGLSHCPGNCGTVFRLSMGLGSFVQGNPNFGRAGQVVGILGNNLTGTTSVTFNGTSAAFKVVSSTYIKAAVPSGATTGTIEVTTPSGTLSSNVAFQVLQ